MEVEEAAVEVDDDQVPAGLEAAQESGERRRTALRGQVLEDVAAQDDVEVRLRVVEPGEILDLEAKPGEALRGVARLRHPDLGEVAPLHLAARGLLGQMPRDAPRATPPAPHP